MLLLLLIIFNKAAGIRYQSRR